MKPLSYFLVFLLMSCSSSKVMYDYDQEVNFSAYKTFAFYANVGEGFNELDINRMIEAIGEELKSKNFTENKNDHPDFFIDFTSTKSEATQSNNVGVGIGGIGSNVGFDISGGIPIGRKKVNEEITIDFVDATNEQVFWQVIRNANINEKTTPEKRAAYFKEIMHTILSKYPPNKK